MSLFDKMSNIPLNVLNQNFEATAREITVEDEAKTRFKQPKDHKKVLFAQANSLSSFDDVQKEISRIEEDLFSKKLTEEELYKFRDDLVNIEVAIEKSADSPLAELKMPLYLTRALLIWRLELHWIEKTIAAQAEAGKTTNKKTQQSKLQEAEKYLSTVKALASGMSELLGKDIYKLISKNPEYFSKHPDMEFKYNYHTMMHRIIRAMLNGESIDIDKSYSSVKKYYDKTYEFNPAHINLHRKLARVYGHFSELARGGKKNDYEAKIEQHIKENPEDIEAYKTVIQIYYNRCIAAFSEGAKEEGLSCYAKVQDYIKILLEKFPNDDEAKNIKAEVDIIKSVIEKR